MLVFPEGSENIQEVSGTLLKIKNTGREQVVLFPSMVLACISKRGRVSSFSSFLIVSCLFSPLCSWR